MTMSSLTPSDQTTASKEVIATSAIRTLVAKHFGVSLGRVTDEMHFTQDLGADWLDHLAFMMAVEEQFAGLEITERYAVADQVLSPIVREIVELEDPVPDATTIWMTLSIAYSLSV